MAGDKKNISEPRSQYVSRYKRFLIIWNLIFIAVVAALAVFVFGPYMSRPELVEHVEVVEKREHVSRSPSRHSSTIGYFISFEFSDGVVRELRVGGGRMRSGREIRGRIVFDTIQVGDTGMLTYIAGASPEDLRLTGAHHFRSFEKDFEHGGYIIESLSMTPMQIAPRAAVFFVSLWIIINFLWILIHERYFPSIEKYPEQTERVEVVNEFNNFIKGFGYASDYQQLRHAGYKIFDTIITFKFPDGSKKGIQIPDDEIYSFLDDPEGYRLFWENLKSKEYNDFGYIPRGVYGSKEYTPSISGTGKLTYKEMDNLEHRFKHESRHWRGRLFVSFERDT